MVVRYKIDNKKRIYRISIDGKNSLEIAQILRTLFKNKQITVISENDGRREENLRSV